MLPTGKHGPRQIADRRFLKQGTRWGAVCPVLMWILIGTTSLFAQTLPDIQFESMFGKLAARIPCYPEDYIPGTGICGKPVNYIPPEGFLTPKGITWLDATHLEISDTGNRKLQRCDDQGACTWLGGDGVGGGDGYLVRNTAGTFDEPQGLQADWQGNVVVADTENQAIQYLSVTGAYVYQGTENSSSNPPKSDLGRFDTPGDAAFDSAGRVIALDTGNDRIQIFELDRSSSNLDLKFLRVVMTSGTKKGQLNQAGGLAVDTADNMIIADTGNNRIQICRLRPKPEPPECSAFGDEGSAPGQFRQPKGVDVDTAGHIWVADTGNNRIQVCDYEGACRAFGQFADVRAGYDNNADVDWTAYPGSFNAPFDIAVQPSGRIAVADTENYRIQFFTTGCIACINPGMNDAWYNPGTPGQGFFITVLPTSQTVFLANFTFDLTALDSSVTAQLGSADQRWLTASGHYAGNQAELEVELASGGRFDSVTPAASIAPDHGNMTLSFSSCSSGGIHYKFPQILVNNNALEGYIPIQRLAANSVTLCEALQSPVAAP